MTYNKKTINLIVEKAKSLLKNDHFTSHILNHSTPEIIMDMSDGGKIELREIRFKHHGRTGSVTIYPGYIGIQSNKRLEFDYEGWEEMLSLDDENCFTFGMLESGMLATTIEGKTYVVMRGMTTHKAEYSDDDDNTNGALFEVGGDDKIPLRDYRDDLRSKYPKDQYHNIVKISKPINYGHNKALEEMGEEVIWTRELVAYEKQVKELLELKNE